MKKIIPIITIALIFILSGCAIVETVKRNVSIEKQIDKLVLDIPAEKLFASALKATSAKPIGKYTAATDWRTFQARFVGQYYPEKERYMVNVTPKGKNKSMLRIDLQNNSTRRGGGKWQDEPTTTRAINIQLSIIRSYFPAVADDILRKAEIDSKK